MRRTVATEDNRELRPAIVLKLEDGVSLLSAHSMHVTFGTVGLQVLLGCSDGTLASLTQKALQVSI